MHYYLNDPSSINLVEVNPNYLENDRLKCIYHSNFNDQLSRCKTTIDKTVNCFQATLSKFSHQLPAWRHGNKLKIFPTDKIGVNACYDGSSLKFCYEKDAEDWLFMADLADVVAHETGHALLDAYRPDFWNMQSVEIWSFHESFADIQSIVTLLQSGLVIEYILKETDGDLRKTNIVSRMGEYLADYLFKKRKSDNKEYIRDAVLGFNYIDPKEAVNKEPHAFGRIFTSVWYEMFVIMYEYYAKSVSKLAAVKQARDTAYLYLLYAVKLVPANICFLESLCKIILKIDEIKESVFQAQLRHLFRERKLIKPEIKLLSTQTWSTIRVDKQDVVLKRQNCIILSKRSEKFQRYEGIGIQSVNKLSKLQFRVPNDEFYIFNNEFIEDMSAVKMEQTDLKICLDYILENDLYGTMWKNEQGNLNRSFF